MSYYKQGCESPSIDRRSSALVQSSQVSGVLDLPEPLPTVIMYFALLFGAIIWVKGGGF